jgi:hypothetical protein
MLAATAEIVKNEGPGALLSGLGPTVVGYGIEGAMKVRSSFQIQGFVDFMRMLGS